LIAQEKRGKTTPTLEQQQHILQQAHACGHYGEKAMYAQIEHDGHWWPLMRDDIAKVIRDCRDCQKRNVVRAGFHPARSITALRPGDHYQVDLAQFPTSLEGHTYCLVMVDVFSGFVFLRPIINKEAATVARALWEIWCVIGIPKILQSDNGSEFKNIDLNTICRLTGIDRRFIAPYNPRADGKVENTVKAVKQTIHKLLHGASALWHLYVPFVQLAYNNKVRDLTGSSPFSLMFGRRLNEMKDYTQEPHLPINMQEWTEHQEKVMSIIFPAIHERITKKQAAMRKQMDAVRKKVVKDELLPGTIVQIKDPLYLLNPSMRPSSEPMYIGPYTIVRRTLYGPYILRDDTGDIYHRQVNIDQMKVVYSPKHLPAAADDNNDDGDMYEVDYIMKHEEKNGQFRYFIKWKGYDVKDASWVSEDDINDPQPVERYFKLLVAKKQAKKISVNSLVADHGVAGVVLLIQRH
jgi:transposase InsO family protein